MPVLRTVSFAPAEFPCDFKGRFCNRGEKVAGLQNFDFQIAVNEAARRTTISARGFGAKSCRSSRQETGLQNFDFQIAVNEAARRTIFRHAASALSLAARPDKKLSRVPRHSIPSLFRHVGVNSPLGSLVVVV
jgi:hypothetical protein